MPYLGVLGSNFKRILSYLKSAPSKFFAKKKFLKFGPKMSDLGIFGLEFENNIVIFEISALVKRQSLLQK